MPPLETQQAIAECVHIVGLPMPQAFHIDPRGTTLHLAFGDNDTTAVKRWAAVLGVPEPRLTGWGRYVSRSGHWYGWAVRIFCDVSRADQPVKLEYGDTIEMHAPSPDPANPAAGALLGVALYRPGRRDYMVVLAHQRPFLLDRREDVIQALETGQVPAEGRPA